MGINVISTASAVATATSAALTGAASGEGLPGNFAALLFGELENLLPSTANGGNSPTATQEPQTTSDIVDPAMIAALIGNAQQAPVATAKAPDGITQGSEPAAKGISTVPAALIDKESKAAPTENGHGKVLAETVGEFGKPSQAASGPLTSGQNRQPAGEAANIAVPAAQPDNTPAALPSQASPVAVGRVSHDTAQPTGVAAHLHESAWPKQFGEKIVWMAKADQQSAQISINPPQLGPVQITLNLSGDQASLAFASPHAEVRQAIESALPQLKEMLASAGIDLGQSNVGANLGRHTGETPFQDANGNRSTNENAILPANDKAANIAGSAVLHRGRGMVDLFA